MNGVHDLGGMQGFGPVQPEPESEEPVFHEEWESRVYGIVRLIGRLGLWNLDMARHNREQLPPADYLAYSYYESWFVGLQKQLVKSDLVSEEELQTGKAVVSRAGAYHGTGRECRAGAGGTHHDHELRSARASATPVRTGRPRARNQPPPARAHPRAALRSRPHGE